MQIRIMLFLMMNGMKKTDEDGVMLEKTLGETNIRDAVAENV